jgi:Arylsulfatase A and related enzymes
MMFGYYASQLGVRSNGGGLFFEDKLPSLPLPEIMRRSGYQTAGFGKTHWNHGVYNPEPPTRGFEFRAEGQPRDSRCYEHGAVMMDDIDPEGLKAYFDEVSSYGSGEENPNGYIGCTSKVPANQHRDGFIADQCLKFLENDVDKEKPLFLYLSFIKPHAGFNVPEEFEKLYNIEDIPDVEQPEWEEESNTHIASARAENPEVWKRLYDGRKQVWDKLTPLERRRTTLRYYANCTWLDSYFGQVLDKLEQLGKLDNSIIIYTSDHGDMMGERNYMFSKYCLYDSSVRVPLIISGSCIPEDKRGTVDDRSAELVDIVPTLAKLCGYHENPMLPGLDLLGDMKKLGSFCEFYGGAQDNTFGTPSYMWRKKEWKLILYLPGSIKDSLCRVDQVKGELYNLENDKHEWKNLYYDDEYSQIREQLKTELLMHLACVWSKGPFFYENDGLKKLESDISIKELTT